MPSIATAIESNNDTQVAHFVTGGMRRHNECENGTYIYTCVSYNIVSLTIHDYNALHTNLHIILILFKAPADRQSMQFYALRA